MVGDYHVFHPGTLFVTSVCLSSKKHARCVIFKIKFPANSRKLRCNCISDWSGGLFLINCVWTIFVMSRPNRWPPHPVPVSMHVGPSAPTPASVVSAHCPPAPVCAPLACPVPSAHVWPALCFSVIPCY